MSEINLYSMFLLGIFGTGHCIGMCGPLIFAFPSQTGQVASHLFYHLGRLTTYTMVGGIMGGIGISIARVAAATGSDPLQVVGRLQVGFSIAAAAFLVVLGVSRLGILPEPGWMTVARPEKIPGFQRILQSAHRQRRTLGIFFTGLLFGFLPCGLSYAAFARALAAAGPLTGAALSFTFGLGTVPGLLLIGTGGSHIARRYRRHSDILAGLVMIAMAAALLADAAQNLF